MVKNGNKRLCITVPDYVYEAIHNMSLVFNESKSSFIVRTLNSVLCYDFINKSVKK